MTMDNVIASIARMQRTLLHIGPDTVGKRLEPTGHAELDGLAWAVNGLLDRLERSEARDRMLLQSMADGIFELDRSARFVSANPAFCRMLGYPLTRLIGQTFASLQGESGQALAVVPSVTEAEPGAPVSTWLLRADGSTGYFESHVNWLLAANGDVLGYHGILHDVSPHVQHQQTLFAMAYRDVLTGLSNRKAFHRDLAMHMGVGGAPLALLFLDLDRFKQVNDTFGHDVGDELLVCMAERLRNAVRAPGKAYRLGGDEFTLILPTATSEAASALAERLLRVICAPVRIGDTVIDFVTPSIGVALAPEHAEDVPGLLRCADQAMYEAKRQRGRVCVHRT